MIEILGLDGRLHVVDAPQNDPSLRR